MPPLSTSSVLSLLARQGSRIKPASAVSLTAARRTASSNTHRAASRALLPKAVGATPSKMVHTDAGSSSTSSGNVSGSGSSSNGLKKNGYATLAEITSSYTSMDPPASPYAPSLCHLNPEVLPPGYEKTSPDATYSVFLPGIEKSSNDDRDYRLIRLDNGLECLLVSDPTTDKSAAGISVRVGHLSDPENAQGMAHFCEHLLFMGTEKYPSENEYNEYLSQNNGKSNAYTGMDETVYYFDIHPPALPGALDRFAQFFIAPRFDDSCTEREILAVDSENKKNLQSDMWRLYQLEKSTSNKDHWYWRFGTGNKETLWDGPVKEGRNMRSELIEWYGKHYSSNLMKLVIVAKDPLDELTKLAAETFAPVKNHKLPPNVFSGTPLGPKQVKQHIYAEAIKNVRNMEFAFPCPDQDPLFMSKPGHFITHYIGHEGEGSILSCLKRLGWADGLSAGAGQGATGFDFFKIHIELTKEGLENHKKVAAIVFAYIDMLRKTDPQEWAFKESQMLSEIAFRFLEKRKPMSYVTSLCVQMQQPYPREWLLTAPYMLKEWNPELVREQLTNLTPEQCKITVVSHEPIDGLQWDQAERWYGTKYHVEPFEETFVKELKAGETPQGLALPQPNSFIPSNLDLFNDKSKVTKPSTRPNCIRQNQISRTWHKLDDRWWVPRATVSFYMKSPLIEASPKTSTSTRFFLDLVMDSMNEYSYDADLAGLSYRLDSQSDGIIMLIDGYNDKLPVLAKVVLEKMATMQIDPKRFDLIKDQIRRQYLNFNMAAPNQLAAFYSTYLLVEKAFLPADKLIALDEITPESLQSLASEVLKSMHIEALVHGNMRDSDATSIITLAEETFKPKPLSKDELLSPRSMIVPDGSNMVLRLPVPNPQNINSALEYYMHAGSDADSRIRTLTELFAQLIDEPTFDTLRTKEQLGYLVHSSKRANIGLIGIRFTIQSERDAAYLEERVESFLTNIETYLKDLPEEQFEKEKKSLANRLREDHKNLASENMHYWINIHSGYYDFDRKVRDAATIEGYTKDDVLEFYRERISPASPTRAKVSVHMQSQHISKETAAKLPAILAEAGVTDIPEQYIAMLSASPLPLLSDLEAAIPVELERQGKSDQTEKILSALRESHAPSQLGPKVELFTDGTELRKRFTPGRHSFPVDEYKTLFAKL